MVREQPGKERTAGRGGPLMLLAVVAGMLLAGLYVLSIGPVTWLVDRNYVDGDSTTINLLYAPLGWLVEHCQPLQWALDGYVELFR